MRNRTVRSRDGKQGREQGRRAGTGNRDGNRDVEQGQGVGTENRDVEQDGEQGREQGRGVGREQGGDAGIPHGRVTTIWRMIWVLPATLGTPRPTNVLRTGAPHE